MAQGLMVLGLMDLGLMDRGLAGLQRAGLLLGSLGGGCQRLNRRKVLVRRFCRRLGGLLPAAVGRGQAGAELKGPTGQHQKPALPTAMQLLPLQLRQLVDGTGQQLRRPLGLVAGQLQG